MSNEAIYPVPANFADAHITPEKYQEMYQQSLDDPDTFWSSQASEFLTWASYGTPFARAIYRRDTHAGLMAAN